MVTNVVEFKPAIASDYELCRCTLRAIVESPETSDEVKILAIAELIKLIELRATLPMDMD